MLLSIEVKAISKVLNFQPKICLLSVWVTFFFWMVSSGAAAMHRFGFAPAERLNSPCCRVIIFLSVSQKWWNLLSFPDCNLREDCNTLLQSVKQMKLISVAHSSRSITDCIVAIFLASKDGMKTPNISIRSPGLSITLLLYDTLTCKKSLLLPASWWGCTDFGSKWLFLQLVPIRRS